MRRAALALLLAACAAPVIPSPSPSVAQWYFDAPTQPARRGGAATVAMHGPPGVTCRAVFRWPGAPADGQPIAPVTTGADGVATLRWTVDPATPPGSWRVDATCDGQTLSTHVPID
jgi:hypothetical protein